MNLFDRLLTQPIFNLLAFIYNFIGDYSDQAADVATGQETASPDKDDASDTAGAEED